MPDDPDLSATLAEAKRIADGLQFACRIPDKTPDFFACGGPAAEAYWEYFTPARISSLLAALEAVLAAHRPNTADGRCNWCRDPDGQRSVFPCGEYLTIRAALQGEETGDGA